MSVKIMAAVWELDLPRDDKIVLLAFADHADDGGHCFPSVDRVAWKCGYSHSSVQRKIRSLEAAGLLEAKGSKAGGRGHPTTYRVAPENGTKLLPFVRKGSKMDTERVAPVALKGSTAMPPEPSEPSVNHQDTVGGDLFESEPDPVALAIGQFCIALDLKWKLGTPVDQWSRMIRSDLRYAGLDFAHEILMCQEYHEGNGRKLKAPDRAIRTWLGNAAEYAKQKTPADGGGNGKSWLDGLELGGDHD